MARGRRRREAAAGQEPAEVDAPPAERMAQAHADLEDGLVAELIGRFRGMDPTFFEGLVLMLLLGMGYGGSEEEAAERLGRTGDEGVDGVIKRGHTRPRSHRMSRLRGGQTNPSADRTFRRSLAQLKGIERPRGVPDRIAVRGGA
jgi:Restriction endonuclease